MSTLVVRSRPDRLTVLLITSLMVVFLSATPRTIHAQTPALQITITDLGTLPGHQSSRATAINDLGQVIGESTTADGVSHTFIWQNGIMTDVGTLDGKSSIPYDINDQRQIVGESMTNCRVNVDGVEVCDHHAFVWQDGVMTDLGTLGGRVSVARAINEQGRVVGTSANHAFVWQDGVITDLGTLPGHISSDANGVNNQGQIVGWSFGNQGYDCDEGSCYAHAILWENGTMTDLGTLGGDDSIANGINDQRQVIGWSRNLDYDIHAFVWQNGTMTDLGTLGHYYSEAYAINDHGQVVGSSGTDAGGNHAVLWQNGMIIDLGTLGGNESGAYDINEHGQIVGWSQTATGERHAVLWTISQPPATPREQIHVIKGEVNALITQGVLNKGQGNALTTKLDGALAKLERGNTKAAANQLHAFVNQVNAFRKSKKLSSDQAKSLVDKANAVITQLRS